MRIERIVTGYLEENCYVLKDLEKAECLVIDPGDDYEKIKAQIGNCKVLKVLLTHNHFDHVGALNSLLENYHVEVLKRDNLLEKEYQFGNFCFKVIYTKGHTSDSITFYFEKEKIMFTGDFLFKGTVGRCDLPTGSEKDMLESINLIKKYPKDIKIYPGHGDVSTLEEEFKNNYYFLI